MGFFRQEYLSKLPLPSPNIPLVNYIFYLSHSRMVSITCFQHACHFLTLEILLLLHSTICCCCCCLVPKSSPTLCDSMDCSPPGSTVHGIFQATILEWVAISFSRGVFPTQGSNLRLLHWQEDSLLLDHQGSSQSTVISPLLKSLNIILLIYYNTGDVEEA